MVKNITIIDLVITLIIVVRLDSLLPATIVNKMRIILNSNPCTNPFFLLLHPKIKLNIAIIKYDKLLAIIKEFLYDKISFFSNIVSIKEVKIVKSNKEININE